MEFYQVKASQIQMLKKADTVFLALWYFKILLRCAVYTQNIWFYSMCLKNRLTPNYIRLRTHNNSGPARRAIEKGQRIWIKEDMKIQYNRRDVANIYLKVIHAELLFRLYPV
ncbi:hypothetical protein HHI36_004533 [Cryptolaemus montrouzieri]|uniref:GIY-YIG homing endonuclease n=1 Tax=Cryptolaemus montrouzieri TaxID=559131 RepID=A0ABD2NS93_9CUCU